MLRKVIALVIGTSLVLVGASFVEDAATFVNHLRFGGINEAHAATSTGGVTLSTTVQQTITLTLGTTTVGLGSLTPGSPVFAVASSSISTNGNAGFTYAVNRNNNPTSTLVHTDATTQFPDATAWNGANAATTNVVGANLHFKVAFTNTDAGLYNSTFWGPNDTDGASNAKYAGFPTTLQTIAATSSYVGTPQTVITRYRIDAPSTQKAGSYSGGITYTAYTNP